MTLPVPVGSEDGRTDRERWLGWAAHAEWHFAGYYKYTFTFTATGSLPGGEEFTATVEVGGDSGAIYRYSVEAEPMTWAGITACGWYDDDSGADPPLAVRKADRTLLFSTYMKA